MGTPFNDLKEGLVRQVVSDRRKRFHNFSFMQMLLSVSLQ
jgi:hypothetical protein